MQFPELERIARAELNLISWQDKSGIPEVDSDRRDFRWGPTASLTHLTSEFPSTEAWWHVVY
jgi:hypothetical protein